MSTVTTISTPTSTVDLFSDAVLTDPVATWRELRDVAPAVYLEREGMWFLGRYDLVRSALEDWETYSSAQGVGMTPEFNAANAQALISHDPPVHAQQRPLFIENLSPRALKPVQETVDARARAAVEALAAQGSFDGVDDLAIDLPINIVMELVGWPEDGRDRLIPMATAWFNTIGPANDRSAAAWPEVIEMVAFLHETVEARALRPGSFGDHMLQVHLAGGIPIDAVVGLLTGYIVAAFDTTISAIGSAVWLLARHPEQFARLKERRALIPRAFNEVIRLESPIQYFTRVTTRDVDLGEGVVIPAGDRVLISYGSANRDERHFTDPDEFRIDREELDHLAFSAGVHACAGQSLARLEGHAVLGALADVVARIELDGPPELALNNAGRGFAHVPVRVTT